jgi:hypothetical protein
MMKNRRDRWVNMGQQRNPEPRFTSRPEYSETPDPVGAGDWDGEGGWETGQDDGPETIV